jgi:hypothetical protein
MLSPNDISKLFHIEEDAVTNLFNEGELIVPSKFNKK